MFTPQELKNAGVTEQMLWGHMVSASSVSKLRVAQDRYLRSQGVRLSAAMRSVARLNLPVAKASEIAASIDPFKPCVEPVKLLQLQKPEGGKRPIWLFGPERRALDYMLKRMLSAGFKPHEDLYGVSRRGVKLAVGHVSERIKQCNGGSYAVTMDIANAFGSVDLWKIAESLDAPKKVVVNTLGSLPIIKSPFHNAPLDFAPGSGASLPQGSAASVMIMAIVINRILDSLPGHGDCFAYGDDFCIVCDTESEAAECANSLTEALEQVPGCLVAKSLSVTSVTKGFEFLGYRFFVDSAGQAHTVPAAKSLDRLSKRCIARAADGFTESELIAYVESWLNSFSNAELTPADENGLFHFAFSALSIAEEKVAH